MRSVDNHPIVLEVVISRMYTNSAENFMMIAKCMWRLQIIGVGDHSCFLTFYNYDPNWMENYKFSLHLCIISLVKQSISMKKFQSLKFVRSLVCRHGNDFDYHIDWWFSYINCNMYVNCACKFSILNCLHIAMG